jgi:hypothetical protein
VGGGNCEKLGGVALAFLQWRLVGCTTAFLDDVDHGNSLHVVQVRVECSGCLFGVRFAGDGDQKVVE